MIKKVLFGVLWYIVIVQLLGFLMGGVMSIMGVSAEAAMRLYYKMMPGAVIIALVLTVLGTVKGIFPGTRKKKVDAPEPEKELPEPSEQGPK